MAGVVVGSLIASGIGTSVAVIGVLGTVGASLLGAVVAGAITSALFKPDAPDDDNVIDQGLTTNKEGNNNHIPVVAGRVRIGGTIAYLGTEGGSNQLLNTVLGVAEGEMVLHDYYFNGEIEDNLAEYKEFKTGLAGQSACALAGRTLNNGDQWTAEHTLNATAYAYVRYRYNADKFPNGVPVLTLDTSRANTLYDPRTSAFDGAGDNPILILREYLTNGVYGRGFLSSEIHDPSFIAAANYCDGLVDGEKRYTANGVIDTTTSALDNVKRILSCCLGSLVFTTGQYKVIIDKPDIALMTFDEDNITGGWKISLDSKKTRLNRVKIDYINEKGDPDIAIVDAPNLRDIDNGLLLEKTLRLPLTNTSIRAKQIGTIVLNQSRGQFGVSLTAALTQDTIRAEIGNVVYIKHQTPGWLTLNNNQGKLFKITNIKYLTNKTIAFSFIEYTATHYNTDSVIADDPTLDTDYPNGRNIISPTDVVLTNGQYVSNRSSGVKNNIKLDWSAALDFSVLNYYVEWKLSADSDYQHLTTTSSTTATLNDVKAGNYDFNIYALTSAGVRSEPLMVRSHVTYASLNPPTAVAGFSFSILNDIGFVRWNRATDLDVIIGGSVEIRHSYVDNGWESAVVVSDAIAGSATNATVPVLQGVYYAKFIDASGVYSVSAAPRALTSIPDIIDLNFVRSATQHPAFLGAKTNMQLTNSTLQLTPSQTTGSYAFNEVIDLGALITSRLTSSLVFTASNASDSIDSRTTNIDEWTSFDGAAQSASVRLLISTTKQNPALGLWDDYQVFARGDYEAWGIKFKVDVSIDDLNTQVAISALDVVVDMPDRTDSASALNSDLGIKHITYSRAFYALPVLGITAKNLSAGDTYTITNETLSGFDIIFNNASNQPIIKQFNYYARGY